ncbi:MAG: JAB domain-containing protein [Polyangiaceae bacterium]
MNATKPSLQKIPVYEVRLVQARRPLRLAETVLTNSSTSARALHALIALTDREHFAALFVNAQHQVTGAHIVAIGAQHSIASVDLRALFRAALAACSCAVVLGHNHPSGDPGPSPEDIATTKHIMIAGKILCIPVLDHLIVTRNPHRYHSMFERGTLPTVPE